MYEVVQDIDKAVEVMCKAAEWLVDTGRPAKHWKPESMNRRSMLQHAEPSEFYTVIAGEEPAAATILQDNERNQSWGSVDRGKKVLALYVHWLCVAPKFRGKGLPKILIDFAMEQAKARGFHALRLDCDADQPKLMRVYRSLDFDLVHIEQEGGHRTAFYQRRF